jgi:hypothetical protein
MIDTLRDVQVLEVVLKAITEQQDDKKLFKLAVSDLENLLAQKHLEISKFELEMFREHNVEMRRSVNGNR